MLCLVQRGTPDKFSVTKLLNTWHLLHRFRLMVSSAENWMRNKLDKFICFHEQTQWIKSQAPLFPNHGFFHFKRCLVWKKITKRSWLHLSWSWGNRQRAIVLELCQHSNDQLRSSCQFCVGLVSFVLTWKRKRMHTNWQKETKHQTTQCWMKVWPFAMEILLDNLKWKQMQSKCLILMIISTYSSSLCTGLFC